MAGVILKAVAPGVFEVTGASCGGAGLRGDLRITRSLESACILPGPGGAGGRGNGADIAALYRARIRGIEKTVLGA
jgi:hypothetical protein